MYPVTALKRSPAGALLALSMAACVSIAYAQVDSVAAHQFFAHTRWCRTVRYRPT